MYNTSMVSFDGGLQAKSMTSQRNRAEPSQDGGYALLWQRYDNNKMVAMRYYGNVMIFYIFNSTVIDWTCYIFFIWLNNCENQTSTLSCVISVRRYFLYRVSQEEWTKLRESVPYVKLYRYNRKHLYPKLNGYGDNGHRKVWDSGVSTYCTPSVKPYSSTAYARQPDTAS